MDSDNANDPRHLFPLPLNSMEKFHLLDHSSQFLNIVLCRLTFEGRVDSEAADRAFHLTLQRHPLWQCRVAADDGALRWVWTPDRYHEIDWQRSWAEAPAMRPFDARRQPGGRPLSRVDGHRTEISFFAQHVLCDGVGGTQFIGDWMRIYHNLILDNEAERGLKRLDPRLLKRRGRLDLASREYLQHLWKQPLGLYGAAKFVGRNPVELGRPVEPLPDWDYQIQPQIISRWMEPEITRGLKRRAQGEGVTVNSLLVAELFRVLHDHSSISSGDEKRWLRVLLPMSLRTFADRRMTSTNRATVVQIDRRPRDFAHSDYLGGIDREIGIIRRWQLSKLFLLAIEGMAVVPGMLEHSSRSDRCRGTVIFANLSEPFGRLGLPVDHGDIRVGNLVLKEIDMAGPIRKRTPANFTFLKHCRRYRVSLHHDPRVLNWTEANGLIDEFCHRLIRRAAFE